MKTIFITGASAGLGKATAKLFQSEGWKVIATMRHPGKETELTQLENVTVLPLDVTNVEQTGKTVKEVIASGGVDVVFNNAGYGLMGPLESTTDEQIVRQINTNLLGVVRVTKAFIPYFRENHKGLFITTTSLGGVVAFPFSSMYHATKWAIEGWSESLAFELNKMGIGIKTVLPGAIQTDFMDRSMDTSSHPAYDGWVNRMFSNTGDHFEAGSLPEEIARVVFEAATDGKDQLRYIAGDDAKAFYAQRLEMG